MDTIDSLRAALDAAGLAWFTHRPPAIIDGSKFYLEQVAAGQAKRDAWTKALDTLLEAARAEGREEAKPALRPALRKFAVAMERKLLANDHKGGWHHDTAQCLLRRLRQETDELEAVVPYHWDDLQRVVDEAADVANFAMMVADLCRQIQSEHGATPTPTAEE